MQKGTKEYRRLAAALDRIPCATIFIGTDSLRSTAKVVHQAHFNSLREDQFWCNLDPV